MIDLQKTHEKLEAFFFKVVMLMGKSSGPPEEASMRLEELVITEVEKKNGLKFVIRHTSIQESGSCGNSLHQKLYKNYSYYNSSNQVSTKHSQAQAAWSIGHDQPMQIFSDPHPFPIHDDAWVEPLVVKLQEEVLSLTTTLATKSQKLAESEKKVSESEKKVSDLEKRLNETGRAGLEADSNEQNDNYEPPTTPQTQDLDLYGSEMVLGASEATMDVCRKDVRITALEVELRERNRQLNERDMQLSEKVTEIKELKEERKKLLAEKDRLYQELLSRR